MRPAARKRVTASEAARRLQRAPKSEQRLPHDVFYPVLARGVGGHAAHGAEGLQLAQCALQPLPVASVDDDARALLGQARRRGLAGSATATRDQDPATLKAQHHPHFPLPVRTVGSIVLLPRGARWVFVHGRPDGRGRPQHVLP